MRPLSRSSLFEFIEDNNPWASSPAVESRDGAGGAEARQLMPPEW
jgi:hypothetical protein